MPAIITAIITPLTLIAALTTGAVAAPSPVPSPDATKAAVTMTAETTEALSAEELAREMSRPPTAAELGPDLLPPLDGAVWLHAMPEALSDGEKTERAIDEVLCRADGELGLTHGTAACLRVEVAR